MYHMVPTELVGTKLIPLNGLKNTHPKLYGKYIKKYYDHPDRPQLLKKQIPKLNCLWNDVLHFLPLHPNHVYKAIQDLGIRTNDNLEFFKIPIERLANNKNAFYLYSKNKYKGPAGAIEPDEIELLNITAYEEIKKLPIHTIEYYKQEHQKGNKFGLFPFIPHVLSLGDVEIKETEIITWNKKE
ncbi:hypothetical protein DFO73_110218 [Cytobacillus oceanisediminis]|uniref:Group-specific protein n=1 Tax=Cytobacillus oceanisediminis TaxID=665099 RepID=A0A2V2ZZH9_9BACI|nr:hypothetical protein DFO73_110218 [Cytobacillus oceanisediminis]